MKTCEPKTSGIVYLRRILAQAKRNKNIKFLTMPINKAEEIVNQTEILVTAGNYSIRQNSTKAAALILCVEPTELMQRMNGKSPKEYMAEISDLKNKIKQLEEQGDILANFAPQEAVRNWVKAKNF